MAKIDLCSSEWCDEIFAGKNKEYGAYQLRKKSSRRHTIALMWVLSITTLLFLLPILIVKIAESAVPKRNIVVTEVTALSKLAKPQDVIKEIKRINFDTPAPIDADILGKEDVKFTAPVITQDDEVTATEEAQTLSGLQKLQNPDEQLDIKEDTTKYVLPEQLTFDDKSANKTYTVLQSLPQFPGGDDALTQYLNQNLKYPFWAMRYAMQGEVIVQFIVNLDGSLSDIRIVRNAAPYLDMEAVRVVRAIPKWTPAQKGGKPVRARCVIPVVFRFQQ
jgi:protein TonB